MYNFYFARWLNILGLKTHSELPIFALPNPCTLAFSLSPFLAPRLSQGLSPQSAAFCSVVIFSPQGTIRIHLQLFAVKKLLISPWRTPFINLNCWNWRLITGTYCWWLSSLMKCMDTSFYPWRNFSANRRKMPEEIIPSAFCHFSPPLLYPFFTVLITFQYTV